MGLAPTRSQPARQQHAERLVGETALERIDDQEMPLAAREGLDQHLARAGDLGALGLDASHSHTGSGSVRHWRGSAIMRAHALGEMRGERELAALVGGDRRVGIAGAGDEGVGVLQPLEAQHLAGEDEGVAGPQLLDEILLELAEHAAAHERARRARLLPGHATPHQADLDHGRLDDGAGIHAVLLGEAGMGEAQPAVDGGAQPRVALVGAQRVAAGGDEIDDAVELRSRELGIGQGRAHLLVEGLGCERAGAGACPARAGPARRGRRCGCTACRERRRRQRRWRRGIPAPRSGCSAPAARARARPAGGWRGRRAG